MRLARMWNSRSPGVETAWRAPARISRKGCSSAGRGCPKRRFHAPDPNPMTQESPPSRSRNSTARTSAESSPQSERTVARFSEPGLSVATRKIAARVSGAATACARAGDLPATSCVFVGSGFIGRRLCVGQAASELPPDFLQVPAKLMAHRGQKFISEVDLTAARSFSSCDDDARNVSAIAAIEVLCVYLEGPVSTLTFLVTKSLLVLTSRYRAKSSDLRFSGTTREIHQAVP